MINIKAFTRDGKEKIALKQTTYNYCLLYLSLIKLGNLLLSIYFDRLDESYLV
jgi:hypothetical protein